MGLQGQMGMTTQQRQVSGLWQRYAHLLCLDQRAYAQQLEQLAEANIFLTVDKAINNYEVNRSAADEHQERWIEHVAQEVSLKEHLLQQWRWQEMEALVLEAGELVISNLDERGFHARPLSSLVDKRFSLALLHQVARAIAQCQPLGCATNNWQESLWVQSLAKPLHRQWQAVGFENFSLALRHWQAGDWLAASCLVGEGDEQKFRDYLKQFTPYPGLECAQKFIQPVAASLGLRQLDDGALAVELRDELLVDRQDLRVLEHLIAQVRGDEHSRRWLFRQWQEAGNVVALHVYRNAQLTRVANWLVNYQRSYLLGETNYLAALELADVARALELSSATVSRVIQNKELVYDYGHIKLKALFSRKQVHQQRLYSQQELMAKIRAHVYAYRGQKISDAKISRLLALEGITLARRTVNKYRHILKI